MRPYQLIYLADLLREQRARLEDLVTTLADRGEPLTEVEAKLLLEAADGRVADVEAALRAEALHGKHGLARLPLRRRAAINSSLRRSPRIGHLRHYPPKPLALPRKYFEKSAPNPAPSISIVTPSFQQGRFLDQALHSVLDQHYPALEYVVQDGGSTDSTLAVLDRFSDLVTEWRSEPDTGQAEAINRGFARTSGEIMAWLNSDDLLMPGALASVAGYFATHPGVDVVYGNRIMIDEEGGQIGVWVLPKHDDTALSLADFIPQETLFWRRPLWEAIGGHVDTSFAFALDWDLLLRFREVGARMVHLPRFLGAFRVHPDQKTTIDEAVGREECDRLRHRLHGRTISNEEVLYGLQPYLARHVRAHNWQRMLDRLPVRRYVVQTMAPDHAQHARPSSEQAATVSPLVPVEDVDGERLHRVVAGSEGFDT